MKGVATKKAGWALMLIGALVVLFSRWIVFPCLEWLVGMETIGGKNNIAIGPDGNYHFINSRPATQWVLAVAVIGVLIWLVGCWLLFQRRKAERQPGN